MVSKIGFQFWFTFLLVQRPQAAPLSASCIWKKRNIVTIGLLSGIGEMTPTIKVYLLSGNGGCILMLTEDRLIRDFSQRCRQGLGKARRNLCSIPRLVTSRSCYVLGLKGQKQGAVVGKQRGSCREKGHPDTSCALCQRGGSQHVTRRGRTEVGGWSD